jgi:hypothetical protein
MSNTALQDKLIDRLWEDGEYAEKILQIIRDGLIMPLQTRQWLNGYLSSLPSTSEVDERGTTWRQYTDRLERWLIAAERHEDAALDEVYDHLVAEVLGGTSHTSQAHKLREEAKPKVAMLGTTADWQKVPHDTVPSKFFPNTCNLCVLPLSDPIHEKQSEAAEVTPEQKKLELVKAPVVWVEVTSETSVHYEINNLPTEQAKVIFRDLLPDMLERFLSKNKDYGDNFIDLGPAAEFVRIANKFGKLKQVMWDGEKLEHESIEEVLDDFLGHVLLARLGLRRVD